MYEFAHLFMTDAGTFVVTIILGGIAVVAGCAIWATRPK